MITQIFKTAFCLIGIFFMIFVPIEWLALMCLLLYVFTDILHRLRIINRQFMESTRVDIPESDREKFDEERADIEREYLTMM